MNCSQRTYGAVSPRLPRLMKLYPLHSVSGSRQPRASCESKPEFEPSWTPIVSTDSTDITTAVTTQTATVTEAATVTDTPEASVASASDIQDPLPRLVQAVTASRCYSCAATCLRDGFHRYLSKCGVAALLQTMREFESSTRFQCMKPIPVRIQ